MRCFSLVFSFACLTIKIAFSKEASQQVTQHDDVQITLLDVPPNVILGRDAALRCEFTSTLNMYSIKWYRNDTEFFYFIPSLNPAKRALSMPGVIVDTSKSNGRSLLLRDVNLDTEGRYKCEVSTEWPHYYTADKSEFLTIVVLPDDKPNIHGALAQYGQGDQIRLLCSAAPSKPHAQLAWLINGKEAPLDMLEMQPPAVKGSLGQSRLSLQFTVDHSQFIRGRMTLRCSAAVASHILHEDVVFHVPVMDAEGRAALLGHSSNGVWTLKGNKELELLLSTILLVLYSSYWKQKDIFT